MPIATDSEEVGAAQREAGGRDDIKAVLLDIDSPGGTVAGTPELAATVASINGRKPVYAFSSALCDKVFPAWSNGVRGHPLRATGGGDFV